MTGKGGFTYLPDRRLRLIVVGHMAWLVTVCALGAWWAKLLLQQASRIDELEHAVGFAQAASNHEWHATHRMLFWESGTYFALLLLATAALFFLYLREARRSRALEAFFASVTHELRTPLTSIRLQAEAIAESQTGRSSQELVNRLLEDSLRLESQVDRTLELARVEGGGPVLKHSIQLKPWLERFVSNWRPSGAELKLEIPESLEIEADPGALQVILRNLLENSVRHSSKSPLVVSIEAKGSGAGTTLVFRDNGPGFDGRRQDLGKLFQKGSRSQGAGVGLYLIAMLMGKMGGRAEFEGGPGFEVRLTFGGAHG
jgi:signal transduction histidine kinase